MLRSVINWKTLLALLAIALVIGSVFYTQYLSDKIVAEEKQKVAQWVAAGKFIENNPDAELTLPIMIKNGQTSIPIIETDEKDSIVTFLNIDTSLAKEPGYLEKKRKEFEAINEPYIMEMGDPPVINKYYYGNTRLLKEVRYFPLVQLLIVGIILIFIVVYITIRSRATQNQVWAGMAKETAHQLGTPITSLQGWVELLKEQGQSSVISTELQKDVDRLKLVSDRFGKIGSKPQLEEVNLVAAIGQMVEYIKKRAPEKVRFYFNTHGESVINARVSVSIFDWVIENLLKNALDAMEGKGDITIDIRQSAKDTIIDISDTGKGIPHGNLERVFKPGYTTKKRGWGLGLSLSRRIIEQYHQGRLMVESSEAGKGTTFRIILKN